MSAQLAGWARDRGRRLRESGGVFDGLPISPDLVPSRAASPASIDGSTPTSPLSLLWQSALRVAARASGMAARGLTSPRGLRNLGAQSAIGLSFTEVLHDLAAGTQDKTRHTSRAGRPAGAVHRPARTSVGTRSTRHTSVQDFPAMSTNQDPDEDLVLDLGLVTSRVAKRLGADGIVCDQDMAVLRDLQEIHQEIGRRHRIRRAFDSVMRNGITRRTRQRSSDAGVAFVLDHGQIADVIELTPQTQPQGAA